VVLLLIGEGEEEGGAMMTIHWQHGGDEGSGGWPS
jgi:hypothetical protein